MINRCFDVATGNGTTGLGIPLNMVIGKVDEDGDLISPLDRLPVLRACRGAATAMTV
jgi:hypothetical protein